MDKLDFPHSSSMLSSNDAQVEELLSQFSDESLLKLNVNTHTSTHGFTVSSFTDPTPLLSAEHAVLDTDLAARFAKLKGSGSKEVQGNKNLKVGDRVFKESSREVTVGKPGDASEQILPSSGDVDVLGAHLAARLAALKAPATPSTGQDAAYISQSKGSLVSATHQQEHTLLPNPSASSTVASDNLPSDKSNSIENEDLENNPTNGQIDEGHLVVEADLNVTVSKVEKLLASLKGEANLRKSVKPERGVLKDQIEEVDDSGEGQEFEEEISDAEVDKVIEWAKDAVRLDDPDDEEDEMRLETEQVKEVSISLPSEGAKTANKKKKGWKFW